MSLYKLNTNVGLDIITGSNQGPYGLFVNLTLPRRIRSDGSPTRHVRVQDIDTRSYYFYNEYLKKPLPVQLPTNFKEMASELESKVYQIYWTPEFYYDRDWGAPSVLRVAKIRTCSSSSLRLNPFKFSRYHNPLSTTSQKLKQTVGIMFLPVSKLVNGWIPVKVFDRIEKHVQNLNDMYSHPASRNPFKKSNLTQEEIQGRFVANLPREAVFLPGDSERMHFEFPAWATWALPGIGCVIDGLVSSRYSDSKMRAQISRHETVPDSWFETNRHIAPLEENEGGEEIRELVPEDSVSTVGQGVDVTDINGERDQIPSKGEHDHSTDEPRVSTEGSPRPRQRISLHKRASPLDRPFNPCVYPAGEDQLFKAFVILYSPSKDQYYWRNPVTTDYLGEMPMETTSEFIFWKFEQCEQKLASSHPRLMNHVRQMEKNGETCPICFDEYESANRSIVVTGCGHFFHQKCLHQAMKVERRCPICRKAL